MKTDTVAPVGAFRNRVITAAEAALKANGAVGPLELFQHMGALHCGHVDAWRQGSEHYRILEESIQLGPEKFQKATRIFAQWVKERGLQQMEVPYTRRTPRGVEQLSVTDNSDPEYERFYRTKYAPADLGERKTQKLAEKLTKPPDLVVFEKVSEEGNCSECGAELLKGSFLFLEKKQPLCLSCADLDHLVFLSAGDMALSRRVRKYSPLLAVVVRFNRSRNQYQRQGVLVTQAALDRAETECAADAPERAARRAQAAVHRETEDVEFAALFTKAITEIFPKCPPAEASAIGEHATVRRSGRVGRCAAGRALEPRAVELAVIAHIRHEHTDYDKLLMQGVERLEARVQVREEIERVLAKWTNR
jgi:hypothetical protein